MKVHQTERRAESDKSADARDRQRVVGVQL